MELYIFTKKGIVRVLLLSLILSAYLTVILLNFASRKMSLGNLFATLIFIAAIAVFSVITKKSHPPLHSVIRGWMIADMVTCIFGVMFSLLQIEFSGFFGTVVGVAVMLFISPFYGIGYIFNNGFTVCLFGALAVSVCLFLPSIAEHISKRRKLAKKYN